MKRLILACSFGVHMQEQRTILITGTAGFIGFHLTKHLLSKNQTVIGFDNLNDYYDPSLKQSRLDILSQAPNFTLSKEISPIPSKSTHCSSTTIPTS